MLIQLKEKKNTRTFNTGAKSSAHGDEKAQERPNAKWNKGIGALRGRPLPDNPVACEKNTAKELSVPKEHQQSKAYANVIKVGPGSITRKQTTLATPATAVLTLTSRIHK